MHCAVSSHLFCHAVTTLEQATSQNIAHGMLRVLLHTPTRQRVDGEKNAKTGTQVYPADPAAAQLTTHQNNNTLKQ